MNQLNCRRTSKMGSAQEGVNLEARFDGIQVTVSLDNTMEGPVQKFPPHR